MHTAVRTIHSGCWSNKHWLGHCEGFRVESGGSSIGIVEEVHSRAESLTVCSSDRDTRALFVPFRDIRLIDPSAERVVVKRAPVRPGPRRK